MQFTIRAAAVLAFAAKVFAQTADFDPIYTPESNQVLNAGETFKVTWKSPEKYLNEKIIISLIGGATQNTQVPIAQIASGVDNSANEYNWAVDASLGEAAVYGLVFKLESNPDIFQYSMPFQIKAGAVVSSSSAAAAVTTGSATATLTANSGVKTVSLSSAVIVEEAVTSLVTVPCNTSTVAPVQPTVPAAKPSVIIYSNQTTLAVQTKSVPVVLPSSAPSQPAVPVIPATTAAQIPSTTPIATPTAVTAGAARVGAPIAIVAGLVMAALL